MLSDLAILEGPDLGVDPEALYVLDPAYDTHIRWAHSGDPAKFDALMVRKDRELAAQWPEMADEMQSLSLDSANTPAARSGDAALISQLRAHLRRTLPEYMIPTTFVMMRTLPLTPNGKIDRKALPTPEGSATPTPPYAAPASDLELRIADIWRELLAIDQVGRQDNIFELGANSLLTMQANSRLSRILGRPLPLVSMFRYPTVAALAAHLAEQGRQDPVQSVDKRAQTRSSRAEQAAERRRALRAERGDS